MIIGKVFTVTEINRIMKRLVNENEEFTNLQVEGEISNFKKYPSGHCYFNLKDKQGSLKAVMFARAAARLKALPKNGDMIVAIGRIDVYERDGVYQLYVDMLMPVGAGDLMQAYEQLKQKLSAEGLFDEARKKSLPAHPETIGIITSSAGAAVRDIITVSHRRDKSIKLLLYPVRVQGKEAIEEIAHGIEYMNKNKLADVLIVGRGGGSMEDLWAFNEERVVRAIAASELPIVSAVGHEIDFTLADFAADLRAPTPSAAAELIVPDRSDLTDKIRKLQERSVRALLHTYKEKAVAYKRLSQSRFFTHPEILWEPKAQALDNAGKNLRDAMERFLSRDKQALALADAKLTAMDPLAILERGYTVTETINGRIIKNSTDVTKGQMVVTRFRDGQVTSQIEEIVHGKDEEQ
ncbi:MAG: exodeoxyribonuclease VII large subunit [Acidaminococcaceae bacterium]|jgi:exodeoxyribonuclease VII large subunit|nr:exodeoxyribonuclease VII large subunit [Acidaminococcaceae bacterium]